MSSKVQWGNLTFFAFDEDEEVINFFDDCARGNLENVKAYVKKNNSLDVKETDGKTSLEIALINNNEQIALFLIHSGHCIDIFIDDLPLMDWVIAKQFSNITLTLFKKGVSFLDRRGESRLSHMINLWMENSVLKVLMNCVGFDLNPTISSGLSPIASACAKNFEEVVNYLLLKGKFKEEDLFFPLCIAADDGNLGFTLLLLQHKVSMKSPNGENTPLHYACLKGHLKIALLLIRNGADVRAKNSKRQIPFQMMGLPFSEGLKHWSIYHSPQLLEKHILRDWFFEEEMLDLICDQVGLFDSTVPEKISLKRSLNWSLNAYSIACACLLNEKSLVACVVSFSPQSVELVRKSILSEDYKAYL